MKPGHLLVDAGNTSVKICYEHQLAEREVLSLLHGSFDIKEQLARLYMHHPFSKISLASVYGTSLAEDVSLWCHQNNINFFQAKSGKRFGTLINGYVEPEKLGVDRWLGMIALWEKYTKGFFVVSVGTAVTFDVVNDEGLHLGGLIIPGVNLMKKSLLQNTEQIQEIEGSSSNKNLLATNTQDAVTMGAILAVTGFLEKIVRQMNLNAATGFLTGGLAQTIHQQLDYKLELFPDLVIHGLSIYSAKAGE